MPEAEQKNPGTSADKENMKRLRDELQQWRQQQLASLQTKGAEENSDVHTLTKP